MYTNTKTIKINNNNIMISRVVLCVVVVIKELLITHSHAYAREENNMH